MQVTTADVIPPNFTASTPLVSKVDETDFTLLVQLNKSSCTVYYAVMLYSTAEPSLASVLAGTAAGILYNSTISATTVSLPASRLCHGFLSQLIWLTSGKSMKLADMHYAVLITTAQLFCI